MRMEQGMELDIFLMYTKDHMLFQKIIKSDFKKGMIVSNEPGYYEKNKFGIRIENLIYVKKR